MFQAKSLEEELYKLKASRSVEDLQKKELEEQLEAEQYFSTLYKTQVRKLALKIFGGQFQILLYLFLQVRELQDEVDEFKDKCSEMEREKEGVALQLQQAKAKADSEALSRDDIIQCCRQISQIIILALALMPFRLILVV